MKIKLLMNIPVESCHGLLQNRILKTLNMKQKQDLVDNERIEKKRIKAVWVLSDMMRPVRLLDHEFQILDK
jgi:hypothetical protein